MTGYLGEETLLDKAKEINKRVKEELGFTVNIGVANNKLLAKMASDFTKPDRIHTLFKEEIKTIGDLAHFDRNILIKKFGKQGNMIWEYANGIDDSEIKYIPEQPKCIGNEITLPKDICKIQELEEILLALTEQVTYRLRRHKLLANSVSVQLKTNGFISTSHQGKLDFATSNTQLIYKKAKHLLKEMHNEENFIRLIGVRVDNLVNTEEVQLSLFYDKNEEKMGKIDSIMDKLKDKYGYNSITLARKNEHRKLYKI